jgi:outer membrane protein assembly factor BamE (lipoprotein component of BamABCDE complex)
MKTIKAIRLQIAALVLCLGIWGCATAESTGGRDFDSSQVSQIVKGKTTSDEILKMFGTPNEKQPEMEDAERWSYYYVTATNHVHNVFVFKEEITGYKKTLNILLNNDKIVVNFTLDEGPLDKQTVTGHPY